MHTTQGDLLRRIACEDIQQPTPITNILLNRECQLAVFYGWEYLVTYTTSGQQLNTPAHKSAERMLCGTLSRDGEYLFVGTENGRISIIRLFPLQLLYTFPQTDSPTRSIAISTNQRLVFGGLESGAIVVFNFNLNRWQHERERTSRDVQRSERSHLT